jgi:hypothetical protein
MQKMRCCNASRACYCCNGIDCVAPTTTDALSALLQHILQCLSSAQLAFTLSPVTVQVHSVQLITAICALQKDAGQWLSGGGLLRV